MGIRAILRLSAIALLLAAATHSVAQQAPTDNELRAAYCLGLTQEELRQIPTARQAFKSSTQITDTLKRAAQQGLDLQERDANERLIRLRSYILPKARYLDEAAILIAVRRGTADFGRAMDELGTCMQHQCASGEKIEECTKRCGESELQVRVRACRELSWLPF